MMGPPFLYCGGQKGERRCSPRFLTTGTKNHTGWQEKMHQCQMDSAPPSHAPKPTQKTPACADSWSKTGTFVIASSCCCHTQPTLPCAAIPTLEREKDFACLERDNNAHQVIKIGIHSFCEALVRCPQLHLGVLQQPAVESRRENVLRVFCPAKQRYFTH